MNGGNLVVAQSAIIGNRAGGNGGGFYQWSGNATLVNSTIGDNSSDGTGAGVANHFAEGGSSALSFINATIVSNTAAGAGSGLYSEITDAITLTNVLLARNAGGNCAGVPVTSLGSNLADDATCTLSVSGDLTDTNPLIAPLDQSTWTYALSPGSPAIDQGNMAACPAVDQRGLTRPHGAACDIGAYEADWRATFLPVIQRE